METKFEKNKVKLGVPFNLHAMDILFGSKTMLDSEQWITGPRKA